MQKTKSLSVRTIVLFVLTVLVATLCFTCTAQAALSYFSDTCRASFETTELEVSLTENGTIVEGDNALLTWMQDENVIPGKKYDERLAAKNTGEYDQYVRVIIKKYWTQDADGDGVFKKDTKLNPALIQLTQTGDWIVDEKNSTNEQVILYSTTMLPVGESRDFISALRIDPAVVLDDEAREIIKQETTQEGTTTKSMVVSYLLDGYKFNIEAEVNAVQTHNAPEAIKGVWGYDVSQDDVR